MAMPGTIADLIKAGYLHDNDDICRGCGAPIEWWTTPEGKNTPLEVVKGILGGLQSHFATCPERKQFRKKRRA
jgi:hypothetical protein